MLSHYLQHHQLLATRQEDLVAMQLPTDLQQQHYSLWSTICPGLLWVASSCILGHPFSMTTQLSSSLFFSGYVRN